MFFNSVNPTQLTTQSYSVTMTVTMTYDGCHHDISHDICHAGVLSSWPVIWYVIWYVMLTFICHATRHCDIFTYFFKVGNMTYQKSSICHADTAMTYTYMSCDMSFDPSWCHMSCDMSCCIFLYRCWKLANSMLNL